MSEPNEVYEAILGQLKNSRSRKSLEALHAVCKEHHESGSVDFRISTIAKLGASRGAPSEENIIERSLRLGRRLETRKRKRSKHRPRPRASTIGLMR